jgi:hypothetical protein
MAILMPSRPRRLFRWLAQAARAARVFHFGQHPLGRVVGQQVQRKRGAAVRGDGVAQPAGGGIDQAALHAGGGGDTNSPLRWNTTCPAVVLHP